MQFFEPRPHRLSDASWSPDGSWVIAMMASTPVLYKANGQFVGELPWKCTAGFLKWTHDGNISCIDQPEISMYSLDKEGRTRLQVTSQISGLLNDAPLTDAAWNPHLPLLAVLGDRDSEAVRQVLYLFDEEGNPLITPVPADAQQVVWSPDGKRLALVMERPEEDPMADGDIQIWQLQQTGGQWRLEPQSDLWKVGTSIDDQVTWSPDGRWLACRHSSYQDEDYLYLLATDGSQRQVKITSSLVDGQLADPSWSPDGKHLLVLWVPNGQPAVLDMESILKEHHIKLEPSAMR